MARRAIDRARRLTAGAVRVLPRRVRAELQRALATNDAAAGGNVYERLYDAQGRVMAPGSSIGAGDFDLIGRKELGLLRMEQLRPTDTLVDLGCGTGRLAVHVIPTLAGGHYVGIDIAASMLDHARALIETRHPSPPCRVTWQQQRSEVFDLADASVDVMCAFSVFTHMEHEDTYRYLVSARRVVRPGGRFLFSCLPLSLEAARDIFLESASRDHAARWASVRNVTTTVEMMETLATMAGWIVRRWYAGDARVIETPGEPAPQSLGQSTCVLERPATQR